MIDNLKLCGIYLFIIFISVYPNSAQTREKSIFRESQQVNSFAVKRQEIAAEDRSLSPRFFERNKQKPANASTVKQNADEPQDYKLQSGEKEINFEFGFSPFAPTHFAGVSEYDRSGRKLGLAIFRFGRVIGTAKGITYEYLFEVNPFVFALKNEVRNPAFVSATQTPDIAPTKRETTYGASIIPAAFRLYFLPESRLKPYFQAGAGIVVFNKPVPVPEGKNINFSGYIGGGLLLHIKQNQAVTISYSYLHLSNASTGDLNPGYNANTFAVGYSFFYK